MLTLDLNVLEREGALQLQEEVPEDSSLWRDANLPFRSGQALAVRLQASMAGTGKILVRGVLSTTFEQPCKRCLKPVEQPFEEEMTALYTSSEEVPEEEEQVRVMEPRGHLLDVSEAVREEVILTAPRYALCDPECRGLCPRCGSNLNETECDCVLEEEDPRWNPLRELIED